MTHHSTPRRPGPPLFAVQSPPEGTIPPSPPGGEAYRAAMPAAQALPLDQLVGVNVDVPAAVNIALGCVPRIREFRAQVLKELPNFEIAHFDSFETLALATAHAHSKCLALSRSPSEHAGLRRQCIALRGQLHAHAAALAQLGLVSKTKVKAFKSKTSDRDLIVALLGLGQLLRTNLESVARRSTVQARHLDEAESLAARLTTACGARETGDTEASAVLQQRQRNFTLLVQAHRQVRRAIAYIRDAQADLEQIVPSLYRARRTGRRRLPPPLAKAD